MTIVVLMLLLSHYLFYVPVKDLTPHPRLHVRARSKALSMKMWPRKVSLDIDRHWATTTLTQTLAKQAVTKGNYIFCWQHHME